MNTIGNLLTNLRTPKYEFAPDESERGVKVSFEDFPDDRNEFLGDHPIEVKFDFSVTSAVRSEVVPGRARSSPGPEPCRRNRQ